MRKRGRTIILSGAGLLVLAIVLLIIFSQIINITVPLKVAASIKIGIIDGDIEAGEVGAKVIIKSNDNGSQGEKTHGSKMLAFAQKLCPGATIYYYDAEQQGQISAGRIFSGLKWLRKNNVKYVNISLSSKYSNQKLREYLRKMKNVWIFASYNNRLNSFDYPAMYPQVIGSGVHKEVNYKERDVQYRNGNIVVLPEFGKVYSGTSYLSLLSLQKAIREN